MTSEKLYHLVRNLTPEEKKKISIGFRISSRKALPSYVILYNRYLESEEWSKESEIEIRGGEFKSPVKYHQARELLLDKIVKVLSSAEQIVPNKAYILKAIELSALGLAKKSILSSFNAHISKDEFLDALSLVHFEEMIWNSLRIRLFQEGFQPSIEFVRLASKSQEQLMIIGKELSSIGKANPSEWEGKVKHVANLLSRTKPESIKQEFHWKRFLSRTLFLGGELEKAIENQRELVIKYQQDSLEEGFWIREVGLFIQLLGDAFREDEANEWTLKLGNCKSRSLQEEIIKGRTFIINGMVIAEKFWRYDLCQKVLSEFPSYRNHFNRVTEALFLFIGAVVSHGTKNHLTALHYLDLLKSVPKKERPELFWQPPILKAMILQEMGEDISLTLRAAKRQIVKVEAEYPMLLFKVLEALNERPQSITPFERDKWIAELKALDNSPKERACKGYFETSLWLNSLAANRSMAELAKENDRPSFNSFQAIAAF